MCGIHLTSIKIIENACIICAKNQDAYMYCIFPTAIINVQKSIALKTIHKIESAKKLISSPIFMCS